MERFLWACAFLFLLWVCHRMRGPPPPRYELPRKMRRRYRYRRR